MRNIVSRPARRRRFWRSKVWLVACLAALPLSAYAGRYDHPAYGTARILEKKGALAWEWSTFHGPLDHFHYDTFTARQDFLGDPAVVFTLDRKGEVAGLRFLDVDFKRRKP